MLTSTGMILTFLDFAIILIMFSHLDALGGFTLTQIAVLYGLSGFAIGVADLLLGNAEMLGQRIRDGTLDQMLVRPVPPTGPVIAALASSHEIADLSIREPAIEDVLPHLYAHP